MGTDEAYNQLREALRSLERFESRDFRADANAVLLPIEFENLDRMSEQIEWSTWAQELMLRSAVRHAPRSEAVRHWASRVDDRRESDEVLYRELADELGMTRERQHTLPLYHLCALEERREAMPVRSQAIAVILRSWIRKGDRSERKIIEYWTRRLSDHG